MTTNETACYPQALVIGYGNYSRKDDGVGFCVASRLRERTGRIPLDPESDGLDDLGASPHVICVHQLTPELAELLAEHDVVVFVDAHMGEVYPEPIRIVGVEAKPSVGFVSHVISPGTIIAMAGILYGQAPQAYLVSVRGHDFDFGTTLSPETQALVEEAVEHVWNLIFETRP
ncbi:MAG: hydrogenase maturation protease [Anaerolineae bacterium]|nr:hydrogenase maturation protease [Anaerolineae bacterium]